ncbi:hypothetical protein [Nostoc sp.]
MKRQDAQQTLRLSTDVQAKLLRVSNKKQKPVSEIIRDAIGLYLSLQDDD